jgi:putative transposase
MTKRTEKTGGTRSRAGEEAALPSMLAFRETDPLTTRVMDQLLLGVSTRGYAASLEVAPAGTRSRATSKSAVSRRLVAATRTQLTAQLGRRLDELDLVALFLDGVHVAGQTLIVALGVAADGSKTPLGIRLSSTENAAICTELLQDLVNPRAAPRRPGAVRDRRRERAAQGAGGRAGHAGGHPALPTAQTTQPARAGPAAAAALRARGPAAGVSRRQRGGRPPPAAGFDELARDQRSSRRRGQSPRRAGGNPDGAQARAPVAPAPLLRHHEPIENLIATLRHVTRNVKRWRAGDMIHRWAGLGLLRAAARFRRIKHHRELPHLVRALRPATSTEVAA